MTDSLHLPARHRERLETLLHEHLPDVEVWAYGSRVDGRSHDGSDLDLVLRGPGLEEIDLMRLGDLQQALHDSTIPFLVEARDWARLPERFHREIEGEYVVFREGSDRLQDVRVPRQRDRDTGVPARWRDCTWGELATLEYGKALRGYREGTGPYRVFGTNGPIGRHEKALHQGPGVIVGRKGAYRGVHYSPDPFFVIDTAFYLKPTTAELDMRWAYYQLLSQDINGMDSGSAIPSTTRASFYALPLRLPPVREQRAIACTLGTLDDKIELNRRVSETLDAMVRAVFSSWFVDFDPVRAKMEGRDTGLPRQVAGLFPDRLVDSELGPIPEGWRAGTLADVAHLNPESWGRKNTPGGVRYVDLANTKWGFIESVKPYAWGLAPSRARRVLRPGDTVVGTVRPGNGSFALVDRDGLTGSTGFAVLRPKATIEREIVYCAATSHGNIDSPRSLGRWRGVPRRQSGNRLGHCCGAAGNAHSSDVFRVDGATLEPTAEEPARSSDPRCRPGRAAAEAGFRRDPPVRVSRGGGANVSRRELISKKTRIAFREFLVGWTLREIDNEFAGAGLEPDRSHDPQLGGQRREYVEQHYHTVDFTNPEHVERVLSVYEGILDQCERDLMSPGSDSDPAPLRQEYDKLLSCLGRDGYELRNGRLRAGDNALLQHLSTRAATLEADYLTSQVDRLAEAVEQDPDLAIGQAKELVETCCKTILAANGESDYDRLDLVRLVRRTMKRLQLLPDDIPDRARGAKTIRAVLGNLATISQGMAELRNLYGTGHGKHASHKRLPIRHGRLAVGAATTLAAFLFETHSERVSKPLVTKRAVVGSNG